MIASCKSCLGTKCWSPRSPKLAGRVPRVPYRVVSLMLGRHLRSANRHRLAVPRFRLNTYGRRAFSVAGPMAWNSLPDFIRGPRAGQTVLGVYLKRTCSRVTSASSALGVLNDYLLYKSTHSLTHSLPRLSAMMRAAMHCMHGVIASHWPFYVLVGTRPSLTLALLSAWWRCGHLQKHFEHSFTDADRIACGAGSMKRLGVRPSVRPVIRTPLRRVCC